MQRFVGRDQMNGVGGEVERITPPSLISWLREVEIKVLTSFQLALIQKKPQQIQCCTVADYGRRRARLDAGCGARRLMRRKRGRDRPGVPPSQ
jgi:hypothetical protein